MMWTSDTASTMCLSQIKVLFLPKIMQIYDEPLHYILSGYLPVS